MFNPLNAAYDQLLGFFVIMMRMGGIVVFFPFYSNGNIPVLVKVFVAFTLSCAVYPMAQASGFLSNFDVLRAPMYSAFCELSIGMILGFIARCFFNVVEVSSQWVSVQMGFGMSTMFDPMEQEQSNILSQFYSILLLMLFIAVNGHHLVLRALWESFNLIPAAGIHFRADVMAEIVTLGKTVFVLGMKLGAPLAIVMFLTNLALGVVARTVPQMNVFVFSLQLSILVGFLVIFFSLPSFSAFSEGIFSEMMGTIYKVLRVL